MKKENYHMKKLFKWKHYQNDLIYELIIK